jgi:hypothetical protein
MSFRESFEIVPDNDNDLEKNTQAIYVGTAGNITVHMVRNDDSALPEEITFSNVLPGTILPIWVRRVLATGTTAGNLIGLRS